MSELGDVPLARSAVFVAQEQRRRFLTDTSENSARYASSFVTFSTSGWGEFQSPDCQYFDTTFVGAPSISHSFYIDGDALESLGHIVIPHANDGRCSRLAHRVGIDRN